MVEKKLIQDTIIELMDANIDKETIYSTLKDIGVDEEDIENNYNAVLASRKTEKKEEPLTSVKKEKEENLSSVKEDASQEEEEISQEELDEEEPEKEVISKKTTKTDFIEKNKSKYEDFLETELKKTTSDVNKINQEDIIKNLKKEKPIAPTIDSKQLSEIEEQVRELKAQMNGLTKIMKDILEENRNILNKLK